MPHLPMWRLFSVTRWYIIIGTLASFVRRKNTSVSSGGSSVGLAVGAGVWACVYDGSRKIAAASSSGNRMNCFWNIEFSVCQRRLGLNFSGVLSVGGVSFCDLLFISFAKKIRIHGTPILFWLVCHGYVILY